MTIADVCAMILSATFMLIGMRYFQIGRRDLKDASDLYGKARAWIENRSLDLEMGTAVKREKEKAE